MNFLWDFDWTIVEIILHNVARRTQIAKVPGAHKGKLSGICWADENRLFSSGVDKTVKMWDMRSSPEMSSPGAGPSEPKPMAVFPGKAPFK